MATLTFQVQNQQIRRTDNFYVVAKSRNYLYAKFTFSDDWGDGTKTAQFHHQCSSDPPYEMILNQYGICLVPWEVLEDVGTVEVTVFGGDLITANTAKFKVHESGYSEDGESSQPPTPSVYQQILDRMDGIEDAMVDATERSETAAQSAEESASDAETAAGKATGSATSAAASAGEASTSATLAGNAAQTATQRSTESAQSASTATQAKADALQAKNDALQAKDDAVAAQTAAEEALESIQTLIAGLQEMTLAMEDSAGNETIVKVLGRAEE